METLSDMLRPDVCGIVYKLTKATAMSNNSNNKNNNNVGWKEYARLTTKGDPMKSGQYHQPVSIEGSMIFTGRMNGDKVLVHELPGNNGQN